MQNPTKKKNLKAEQQTLESLTQKFNEVTRNGSSPISVECGIFRVEGVTGVQKAPAKVKADFMLMSGTTPVFWISHKAACFGHNGYGRGGAKAFPSRSPYHCPTIWRFARWAAEYCINDPKQPTEIDGNGFFKWTTPQRGLWCIPPKKVANLIVYGPQFGHAFGPLNCQVAAVGGPVLTQSKKGGLRISFERLTSNGAVPEGTDAPVIGIGGCIGAQEDKYQLYQQPVGNQCQIMGFHGWLAFFSYGFVQEAEMRAQTREPGRGKADGMIRVAWPADKILKPFGDPDWL